MRKRGSKLRGCFVGLMAVVGVLALVVVVGRSAFRRAGDRQLAVVVAKLDAEDPGWRFDAINAARARAAPPDEVNPARVAVGAFDRLNPSPKDGEPTPPQWDRFLTDTALAGPVWAAHPALSEFLALYAAWSAAGDAPTAARDELLRPDVSAQPGGFFRHRVMNEDNPYTVLLPDVQKLRTVFALLEVDARVAVLAGDPDRAVRDARATLVAVRAIGDEPFLISQLVRMAGVNVACRTVMQVLAWGEPAEGLAEFQAELLAEADHPGYLIGLRGERAGVDKLFDGLQSGKLGAKDLIYLEGGADRQPQLLQEGAFLLYKGFLPGDRAEALRVLTEYIEAAKLPLHEQKAAVAAVQLPPKPPDSFRYLVTRMIVPAVERVHEAHLRTRGELRAAATAIACERFRRKTGVYPQTLGQIPKDILAEVPADPYTGRPLGYVATDAGVAVTFTADDRPEPFRRAEENPMAGLGGRGWRLWYPKARGTTRPAPNTPFTPEEPDADAAGDGP
ncbi:MAG: hypothetical protein K2X82_26690 [Gemmataceae bacterium]|nr:hypothetical protein [Gemmataceae bacterium]